MSVEAQPRAFVDTNVLVYAHDRSAGDKHLQAQALVKRLWETQGGCISVQVLQELYVTLTQKIPRPLSRQAAARLIESISFWRVHAPQARDVLATVDVQTSHFLSFWDAMIVQSALQLGCQTIYSEDLVAERVYAGVKVVNPFVE